MYPDSNCNNVPVFFHGFLSFKEMCLYWNKLYSFTLYRETVNNTLDDILVDYFQPPLHLT